MSSILKALKKLEQESASNAGARSSANAEKLRPHRKKKILIPGLIVLAACILIGGGIGLFARKTIVPEPPAVNSTSEQTVISAEAQSQNVSGHESPGSELSEPKPSETEFSEMPPVKQEKIIPPEPEFAFATPGSALADDQPKESENDGLFQPDTLVGNPPPETGDKFPAGRPFAPKRQASVEILEDPVIELQAISWSAEAEKRMAIINGKICREKERVAGYVIDAINPEDVIVSKGSVSGKLVFKVR